MTMKKKIMCNSKFPLNLDKMCFIFIKGTLSWCSSLKTSKHVSQLAGTFIEFSLGIGGGGVGRGRICYCIVVQLTAMRFLFSDSFVAVYAQIKWFSLVNSALCC